VKTPIQETEREEKGVLNVLRWRLEYLQGFFQLIQWLSWMNS